MILGSWDQPAVVVLSLRKLLVLWALQPNLRLVVTGSEEDVQVFQRYLCNFAMNKVGREKLKRVSASFKHVCVIS